MVHSVSTMNISCCEFRLILWLTGCVQHGLMQKPQEGSLSGLAVGEGGATSGMGTVSDHPFELGRTAAVTRVSSSYLLM